MVLPSFFCPDTKNTLQRNFWIVCSVFSIQHVSAWEYLGQDEDNWYMSILALGVLVVIVGVMCCVKRIDPYVSPVPPYEPRDGVYTAEYREPDGVGTRQVHLKFLGDEEKGWKILPEEESGKDQSGDRSRKLRVKGGYVDITGKMWWEEEGPSTQVESYGRYNLSQATFQGTWLATYNVKKDSRIAVDPSKSKNIRRVKYTKFYHSGIYGSSSPTNSENNTRNKDLSKMADKYSRNSHKSIEHEPHNSCKKNIDKEDDYVNVTVPCHDEADEVMMARADMSVGIPSGRPSQQLEPRGAASRIFFQFNRRRNDRDNQSPSPEPDYVKLEDTSSIGPNGNEDATMNSGYQPDQRGHNPDGYSV
jgi:hypothetical protein